MPETRPILFKDSFINKAVSKTVLTYAGFAALWILLSDQAIFLITDDLKSIALINTIKGWLFVAATSALLAFMIRRYLSQLAATTDQLIVSEERWKFALEGAGDGVWDWKIQTGTALFSKRWKEILGYTEDEIGQSADEWINRLYPEDVSKLMADLEAHIEGKTTSAASEFRMRHKDGHWKWILGRGIVVSRDEAGLPVRLVGTITDISDRKFMEEELQRKAHIDALTGVMNRGRFMEQAEQEITRAARYGKPPCLLLLDIDWFKQVNDTHGHKAGDHVLIRLTKVCRKVLREVDTIGRMGSEEFAVLLPETGKQEAADVAERLRLALGNTKVPLEQDLPLQFTVSIGVASVDSKGDNIDLVLGRADKALHEAKQSGHNRVCVATQ